MSSMKVLITLIMILVITTEITEAIQCGVNPNCVTPMWACYLLGNCQCSNVKLAGNFECYQPQN